VARALTIACAVLAVICILEARALVALKADLADLRTSERVAVSAGQRMAGRAAEIRRTTDWLQAFYESPDGLKRAGGLCAGGTLDSAALTALLYDTYLRQRFDGATEDAARQEVVNRIRAAPEWRRVHDRAQ